MKVNNRFAAGAASVLAMTAGLATGQAALAQSEENAWFQAGQAEIEAKLARQPITGIAKNVIIFLADGNGVATNYAARIFQGQQKGGYGDDNVMHKESLPYLALSKTYNTNAQTPDSAGTAVAFMSGIKTKSGVIGVDETLRRGECADVEAATIPSIGDFAAESGRSVGIVSTARVTHATPSAVYANAADRDYETDVDQPEDCAVPDIAAQLMENMESGTVDLVLGGGRRNFVPAEVEDPEGASGRRGDGHNMWQEATDAGYQMAWDNETFAALALDHSAPVLGLFESSHMAYEHDRDNEPSIQEMTEAAITYLANNEEGYFLLVEGGRVDHANHDGNAYRSMTDGVAFDEAVAKAVEMTNQEDTLIVVTADHGHAMAFNGYCGRGSPIEGLCLSIDNNGEKHLDDPEIAADGKPYTAIGYLNGTGSIVTEQVDGTYFGTRPMLTQEEATDPDYIQQAMLPQSAESHSPVDVAIYASGPWAHLFDGTVEQNYIYHVMRKAFEGE